MFLNNGSQMGRKWVANGSKFFYAFEVTAQKFGGFGSSSIFGGLFFAFFPSKILANSHWYHEPLPPKAEASSLLPHRTEVRRSTPRRVRSEGGSLCPP